MKESATTETTARKAESRLRGLFEPELARDLTLFGFLARVMGNELRPLRMSMHCGEPAGAVEASGKKGDLINLALVLGQSAELGLAWTASASAESPGPVSVALEIEQGRQCVHCLR